MKTDQTETTPDSPRLHAADCSAWVAGDIPDIPHGTTRRFWVTMRNKASGKRWVKPMRYMNGHVMPLADSCDDPGPHAVPHDPDGDGYCEEYEWTGWSEGHCEYCECEWMWTSHYVEIIAHAPMIAPEPFEPNAAALPPGGAERSENDQNEQTNE